MSNMHKIFLNEKNDVKNENSRYQMSNQATKPVKTPSPDRKSANIIKSTRSPELSDIKRQTTPLRQSLIYSKVEKERSFNTGHNRTPRTDREFQQSLDNREEDIKNSQNQHVTQASSRPKYYTTSSNSNKKHLKIELEYEADLNQFESRRKNASEIEYQNSNSNELDYLKLLRQKQQTIKELHDIIQMINRNSYNGLEPEEDEKVRVLEKKLSESNGQIRILTIQNQKLISVIQNNHVNITSNKQQILQRQIRELRQSLTQKQQQLDHSIQNYKKKLETAHHRNRQVELENERLVKLINNNTQNTNIFVSKSPSDKQKLTLTKIKEQYSENLKLMKQNFNNEIQQIHENYQYHMEQIHKKLDFMNDKLHKLEIAKFQWQSKKTKDTKLPQLKEEIHKEKERHQEIQSLMIERYNRYEVEVNQVKKKNQIISLELIKSQKYSEELQTQLNYLKSLQSQPNNDQQIYRLRKEQEQNRLIISKLEYEYEAFRKKHSEYQKSKQNQIKNIEAQIESIINDYRVRQAKEEQKRQNQIERIKLQYSKKQSNLQNQLYDSHKQFEDYKVEMQAKIRKLVQIYSAENDVLKNTINQRALQNTRLNDHIETLKNQLKNSPTKQSISQNEAKLLSKIEENEDRYNKLLGQYQRQRKNGQLVEQFNNALKQQVNKKDRTMEKIEKDKQNLADQNNRLLKQIDNLKKIVAQDEQLKKNFQQISIRYSECQNKLQKSTQLILANERTYKNNCDMYQNQIKARDDEINDFKIQISQMESTLSKSIRQLSQMNDLYNKSIHNRKRIGIKSIEEQLKQLKKLISEQYLKTSSKFESQIIEDYYRLLSTHQQKIQQNQGLTQQINTMQALIFKQQQQKLLLKEKITFLENNIIIYENELKERKYLYEKLVLEKSRIEKEILLTKKIRAEQNKFDEEKKISSNQINFQIDRLLEIERQRIRSVEQFLKQDNQTIEYRLQM